MKKANNSKATTKKTTTKRKPQIKSKKRKQAIRPVEMWVLVATMMLIGYLITHVTNEDGVSFMTIIMMEMGVIS